MTRMQAVNNIMGYLKNKGHAARVMGNESIRDWEDVVDIIIASHLAPSNMSKVELISRARSAYYGLNKYEFY